MKKTAIITGVTGQDGSYLSELLLSKDYRVVGTYRRTVSDFANKTQNISHILEHKDFILEEADVTDSASLYRLVHQYQPEEYYNLAAQSHVGTSFKTPVSTTEINLMGCLYALEAIRLQKPSCRFYQASTSEMFGDNTKCPQGINTTFSPVSPYACAKLAAHHMVGTYRKSYGIFAASGILFNHESPRRGENFVTRKITKAAARIKLGLQDELRLGNLTAERDWGHAEDFVEGMQLMMSHEKPDDYVLATGEVYSIRDFVNLALDSQDVKYFWEEDNCFSEDKKLIITTDKKFFRPAEVNLLQGDSQKARVELGWNPKHTLKTLVKEMVEKDISRLSG